MKNLQFPIFKTKMEDVDKKFNLIDSKDRQAYFEAKAGDEIDDLKDYLSENSFIAYLLGKKSSGKGTLSKMLRNLVGKDKMEHISIGDLVRDVHKKIENSKQEKADLIDWLEENYRGYMPVKKAVNALLNRDTSTLLPSEFILALVKRGIEDMPKKTLFIDGFPRNLDQISYSLFFRDLVDYRYDPDVFVLIDVPETVIDQRIKYRVVCPKCHTSRNLKFLPTEHVGYDQEEEEFYLMCDNPECNKEKMVTKEGDELGIEAIKDRLETDEKLIRQAFSLHGIPKVLLRNAVPVAEADDKIDDYEITPEYIYKKDEENDEIKVKEEPWIFENDEGIKSYSLMPEPVVVSLIKQLV
ncbi:MAG: nucleoside monophosphate kinase, partial [Minisyncoccales bacterium]